MKPLFCVSSELRIRELSELLKIEVVVLSSSIGIAEVLSVYIAKGPRRIADERTQKNNSAIRHNLIILMKMNIINNGTIEIILKIEYEIQNKKILTGRAIAIA